MMATENQTNDRSHYNLKKPSSIDINHGFYFGE
ncbi:hypothetical protein LCGC14_1721790, partial [marine sediment metagenome]